MQAQQTPACEARVVAARILAAWLRRGRRSLVTLSGGPQIRPLVTELVYAVIRDWRRLDWIRSQMVLRQPPPALDALLLLGLEQLLFLRCSDEHAAVYETVEAARRLGGERAAGFVNAVLRRAQAEKNSLLERLRSQPIGIQVSHPDILLERWSRRYGAEAALAICGWNNQPASVTLRVRDRVPELIERLAKAGVRAWPHPADPERFVELGHGARVTDLPGYAEGLFWAQDPATTIPVDLLEPKSGENILDACAAPGGKTLLIADAVGKDGRVTALDASAQRLKLLQDNLRRVGATNVDVICASAADPSQLVKALGERRFDGVLVDAPCTNTGVLRRRPEARWRFSVDALRAAVKLQRRLLEALCPFVAAGGRLVYSTCSLEPEENEELVRSWLEQHSDYRLEAEMQRRPPGTDGVYAALLIRTA